MMAAAPDRGVMLETALQLAERGFHVIPLGDPFSPVPYSLVKERDGDEDSARYEFCKKARIQWREFQTTPPDDEVIRAWFAKWPRANIGIITGINVVVVDGDTPEACAFLDSSAVTRTPWRVKTARGYHYYFRVNPSLIMKNSAAGGLDIRGAGGYVVAAGSTSGNGVQYEWQVDLSWGASEVHDLPMLTPQDVQRIFTFRGSSQPTNETGEPTGDVLAHLGAVHVPHDGTPARQGSRNNALASLVGQWINKGLTFNAITQKAIRFGAECTPPMGQAEIIATVASVVATHRKNGGEAVPEEEDEDSTSGGISLFNLDNIEQVELKPLEQYWRDGVLFRGSRLLISGGPKIGKSRFFLSMAVAAAHGGEFLGEQFHRPLRVLWVQAEIHINYVARRMADITQHLDGEQLADVRKNLFFTGRVDLDLTERKHVRLISQAIEDTATDIVCFDPAINFSSADENKNPEVRKLLRTIDQIGEKHDCAVVLIHHTRKDADAGNFDSIRGASAFRGWYDTGIMLTGDAQLPTVSYECRNVEAPMAHGVQYSQEAGLSITSLDLASAQATAQDTATGKRSANIRTADGDATHDRKHDHDFDRERRINKAMMIVLERPGIGYSELTHALMRSVRPNISERLAKDVISELKNVQAIRCERVGKNAFYYADGINKNEGENQ